MKLVPSLVLLALAPGLLVALPASGFAQVRLGVTGSQNTNYATGVMGGASAVGSDIPRHATASDNWTVYRGTQPLLPPFVQVLTAQIGPQGQILLPPVLLVTQALPADAGLAPFSPAGTVGTQGAY